MGYNKRISERHFGFKRVKKMKDCPKPEGGKAAIGELKSALGRPEMNVPRNKSITCITNCKQCGNSASGFVLPSGKKVITGGKQLCRRDLMREGLN